MNLTDERKGKLALAILKKMLNLAETDVFSDSDAKNHVEALVDIFEMLPKEVGTNKAEIFSLFREMHFVQNHEAFDRAVKNLGGSTEEQAPEVGTPDPDFTGQ